MKSSPKTVRYSENTSKSGKKPLFFLKLLVSIGLCAWIILKVEWNQIWLAIRESNLLLIIVVFIAMVFNVFISTLKWRILLKIHNIPFGFNKLIKYYFSAGFFNNFLPSTIGGDAYRIFKTAENKHHREGAIIAVFMERITGVLALIFWGFVSGIVLYLSGGNEIARFLVWFGVTVFGSLLLVIIVLAWKTEVLKRLVNKYLPQRIINLLAHITNYRKYPCQSFLVALLALFFQAFLLTYRLLLVYATGASLSIFGLAVAVTISTIVALVPISINGIGLLDGSFIYLLNQFGMEYEQAVIVTLLVRALNIPLSLVGGIFYFFDKKTLQINESSTIVINEDKNV